MEISVIIPSYNSQDTILQCLDSVVSECVAIPYSWELIIVDDGSTDLTPQLIENYINKLPYKDHIKFLKQVNGGAAKARNTGIELSSGKFIAFNDSDDRWLEGKLKQQMDFLLRNPDVVLVAGIYGATEVNVIKRMSDVNVITIKDQVLKNYFSPPTVLFRKSILQKSGLFNSNMRYAEEGYFFNNIVYNGESVLINKRLTEPILDKARWGDSGLSGNLLKMELGELYNIKSAYRFGYISLGRYIFALIFSLLKFCRRWVISNFRKLCK